MNWDLLAGPAALAVAASLAVVALWKSHVKGDDLKDATIKSLTDTVSNFPPALNNLTSVVVEAAKRERNRAKTERTGD